MHEEIMYNYGEFCDSLISEITYRGVGNTRTIDVTIDCMNVLNDCNYEMIKITFYDVILIQFRDHERQSTVVINSTLILNENDIILFDFSPLVYGEGKLKENENSDFKIRCRRVSYVVIK